jgi:2'-5' RNA ligase
LRSFIAIELPGEVKASLAGIQQSLKKSGADIRWVKTDNIHLTLKFLGDIEEKSVASIIQMLKGTCKNHKVFSIEISNIGTFPVKRSPRVLWAGINDHGELMKLQLEIDKGMASLGFEPEKRVFSPHLTFGRFRSSRGRGALMEKIDMIKHDSFGLFDVRSIYLIKSDLNPSGAVYSRLAEFPLDL